MTYEVRVRASAAKALTSTLPERVAAAVLAFFDGDLSTAPRRVGKPLLAPFEGVWSARRGEYRILYRVDDEPHTVTVEHIKHRRDAYSHH